MRGTTHGREPEAAMNDLILGRDRTGDPSIAGRREWLVTNGIGGFAAGTVSGALTRRYHGLLVAALKPPVGRTLLLAKLAEQIEIDRAWIDLDTNLWASGTVAPRGYLHLESFRIEDAIPTWTWAIGDTRLEKRVWMELGENTTYVQYRLGAARGPVKLALRALVDCRDVHAVTPRGEGTGRVEPATGGLRIEVAEGATPLWITAPGAECRPEADWYRGFALPLEAERGLESVEDHLLAATLTARLEPGEAITVAASTRHDAGSPGRGPLALASALARRRAHSSALLDAWKRAHAPLARTAPPWIRQLVLAADAFVVERGSALDPRGRTVIAGYPWFSDWGRDTMIALPGLTLATGRPELARSILATFARHVDQGMLPNFFPDGGEAPEYNTVDAALWFFQAVRAYVEATGDQDFLAEMFPVLEDIGAWYERGTRHGIRVDQQDGLVRAGEEGVQLTWMDAKVDEWVVTPRRGKPVEINALWYNAATSMAGFARRLGRAPEAYEAMAEKVEKSFERFWNPEAGCLYDVVDGPKGHDPAVRPNQIFALSLPDCPLPAARRRAVLETCGRWLLTSHGLRSLAPSDSAYRGVFAGDRYARDGAYHQGTVWTWLLPHYALAHYRVHGDRDTALALLAPLAPLMEAMAIGTLPEVADGDPPHAPRGCFAQAWTVAETLRAWQTLAAQRKRATRRGGGPRRAAVRAGRAVQARRDAR